MVASGILPLDDGRVPVTCSSDTGWQGGSSRMTYNSQSGQTTLCRAWTKKVVAYKFFSKLCHTCCNHQKKNNASEQTSPPIHRCPKNWTKSSKAMEPNGILECAISVWNSCIVCMDIFLSNNDSSSRCVLKHPIKMQMKKGYILKWPVDKYGKNVKCTGWLPPDIHPVTMYLVDPSHRHCVYGSHLYKLEKIWEKWKRQTVSVSFTILGMLWNRIMKKQKRNLWRQWLLQWSIILITMTIVTHHGVILEMTRSINQMTQFVES